MRNLLKRAFRLSSKEQFSGKWLRFKTTDYMIGDRKIENYEYIERTTRKESIDGVNVITFVKYPKSRQSTKLVLIGNYRPPLGRYVLEWPAGLVANSERFYEEALRELKEETGYIGKQLEAKQSQEFVKDSPRLYSDPWKSNECGKFVFAEVDGDEEQNKPENLKQSLEETEDIVVHLMDMKGDLLKELVKLAEENDYEISGKVYLFLLGMKFARAEY